MIARGWGGWAESGGRPVKGYTFPVVRRIGSGDRRLKMVTVIDNIVVCN